MFFHRHRHVAPDAQNACPECGANGMVQVADLIQGVDVVQCRPCRHRWQISRSIQERLGAG